jgi:hypothetical protein
MEKIIKEWMRSQPFNPLKLMAIVQLRVFWKIKKIEGNKNGHLHFLATLYNI